MVRACRTFIAISILLAAPRTVFAQPDSDVMYIGDSLLALRMAVNGVKGFTPISVKQILREQIVNPDLVVLLVPPPQKMPPDKVRLLRSRDSSPTDFDVDSNDLGALRNFRTNILLTTSLEVTEEFAKNGDDSPTGQRAVLRLLTQIKSDPNAGPFVGGLLAAQGIRHPELAAYVREYQASLLEDAKKTMDPKKVREGNAYYFGPTPVTKVQLAGISWLGVGTEVVDEEKFQKVWIGASVVLVKPTKASQVPSWSYMPDGLDELNLNPTREKEIRFGHTSPSLKLERLPTKE